MRRTAMKNILKSTPKAAGKKKQEVEKPKTTPSKKMTKMEYILKK